MSAPRFADTQRDGSRWYVLNSGERFISVTTVLGGITRYGLLDWAAKLAAETAMDSVDRLAAASDPCNSRGDDACGICRTCVTAWVAGAHVRVRDAAGDRGTRLHEATAHYDLFGEGGHVDEDVRPLFDNYRTWIDHYRPEIVATDVTVVSRKWGYAGSLDKIIKFGDSSPLPASLEHLRGANLVLDEKTGKHVGIAEGLQVAAYARADAILLDDGTETELPPIGGGLILHNRPEKIQAREVHVTDANHALFVHALRLAEGMGASLNSVLSRPVNLPKKAGK
jgi:hypothetical protein